MSEIGIKLILRDSSGMSELLENEVFHVRCCTLVANVPYVRCCLRSCRYAMEYV